MTTKPDYNLIQDLMKVYSPQTRGIVTDKEAQVIRDKLELNKRTVIELHNIRNTVVMMFMDDVKSEEPEKMYDKMDAMSAITTVIDGVMISRGESV